MTLCIAALASIPSPASPCILLCFDYKIANDAWGSESEYKFHVLSEQLVALVAGSPAKAKELANIYRVHLGAAPLSKGNALEELRKPLLEFKLRRADFYVRSRLAVPYLDLLNNGEAWFGKARVEKCLAVIEKNQPNVEMIIAGFIEGEPAIYQTVVDVGTGVLELDQFTNFCLVGSGAATAEPALHTRTQMPNTPMPRALYNVYEAKKVGESSPFVGQKTRMFLLEPPKGAGSNQIRASVVTASGEIFLQRLFRKYGPKPMKMWPDLPEDTFQKAHFKWPPK